MENGERKSKHQDLEEDVVVIDSYRHALTALHPGHNLQVCLAPLIVLKVKRTVERAGCSPNRQKMYFLETVQLCCGKLLFHSGWDCSGYIVCSGEFLGCNSKGLSLPVVGRHTQRSFRHHNIEPLGKANTRTAHDQFSGYFT